MVVTEDLTELQWKIAHAIAQTLVKADTDANELGKAIAYLRNYANQDGTKLFDYLKTLVKNGRQIGHSKRTSDYYQAIDNACNQYLKAYQDNPAVMLHILGWSYRLYRILYAFDPRRVAVLLLGGNKVGNNRWYEENVPKADKLYDELLEELGGEELI